MTTDTITIPAEIPREILDGDKVLKVVGWELRGPKLGEFILLGGKFVRQYNPTLLDIACLVPIIEPVPRYIYPTPVEACRMIADAGGPIECEALPHPGATIMERRELVAADVTRGEPAPFKCWNDPIWKMKIRVLQPE